MPATTSYEPLLVTRPQAAKLLGVSPRTIDKWAKAGQIKPSRLGRLVRFQRSELERIAHEGIPSAS